MIQFVLIANVIQMKSTKVINNMKNIQNKEFQRPQGITIDWSDEYENANDSIRVNREFDSNEIDENPEGVNKERG
jgi:hypothetical protein